MCYKNKTFFNNINEIVINNCNTSTTTTYEKYTQNTQKIMHLAVWICYKPFFFSKKGHAGGAFVGLIGLCPKSAAHKSFWETLGYWAPSNSWNFVYSFGHQERHSSFWAGSTLGNKSNKRKGWPRVPRKIIKMMVI